MSLTSRTFYVSSPAPEAYREWKSLISTRETGDAGGRECSVIRDVPGKELQWLCRWGIALIDTRADFIPAQGGCVVHLNIHGINKLSRLFLSTVSPLKRGPWSGHTASHHLENVAGRPVRDF
jgi:hypothetical protein